MHRFDDDPTFCRLLDAERGGYFRIRPVGPYEVERAYLDGTNVLRTVFTTASGRVALTDFMPVGRRLDAGVHDYVSLNAPGWLVRGLERLAGEMTLEIAWRPSIDFAATRPTLALEDDRIGVSDSALSLFGAPDLTLDGDRAYGTISIDAEHPCADYVVTDCWSTGESPCERVAEMRSATVAYWREWLEYCRYDGPERDAMHRSALVLKLMIHAPSGAMVAAPTTSLPEDVGGSRNWDYRYCWVRDTSFALYALAVLGYAGEVTAFHRFLTRAVSRSLPTVRPLYTLDASDSLEEFELDHLAGYRDSRPVRIGNGAADQRQIDAYGHLLDLALVYRRLGGEIDEQYGRLLTAIARFVEAHWREPGRGMWEMRGEGQHHVHDKLMSWVAMDRAALLLDEPRYRDVANDIEREIRERGGPSDGDGLRQTYDGGTDSAPLLAPMVGFSLDADTLSRTLDRVQRELADGEYFKRYIGDDGLDGEEGAFLLCSAWFADVELVLGRVDAARERLTGLLGAANDVGLLAEEIDAGSGALLGNFPQALSHLGVVMSLVNLELAERDGPEALAGSYADRAERAVGASFGPEGLIAALVRSGRVSRFRSSTDSMLAWP